ncbi:MAG: hypothetical protein U0167_05165 [bacterium]
MTSVPSDAFYEVAVEGHFERSHGLLLGLVLGAGVSGKLYFSHEEGIRATIGERLREMVGLHAPICHAVVDEAVRALFERRKADLAAHDVRLAEVRAIRSSRFAFHYRAYAPRYTQEIQALLSALPEGVTREGGEPRERVDETSVGIEAYAPAHHYECDGAGTVGGRVDLVIDARRRLAGHPLVKVERIELELA